MALASTAICEINSSATASNVNAGFFNPGNANFATDGAVDTNTGNTDDPVFSSASYNFAAGDVGHYLFVKAGTNCYPGFYPITAVAGNKATLGAAVGEAQYDSNNRFSDSTNQGIASVGTPTGITWGIDYSRSTSNAFTATDLASTNATTVPPTVSSATVTFGVNTIGNHINIRAGTQWTQAIYEIVSVSGGAATLDKACGTAATPSGNATFNLGGAISLGTSAGTGRTDDAVFEYAVSSATAASRFFVKSGSYSPASIAISAVGNSLCPIIIESYASTRGDRPTGVTRASFAMGANGLTIPARSRFIGFIVTGTAASTMSTSTGMAINCKVVNNSTIAARNALNVNSAGGSAYDSEFISYRGNGVNQGADFSAVVRCYIHDSDKGIVATGGTGGHLMMNNIVACCVTAALDINAAQTRYIQGNTLYGHENTAGTGINLGSTAADLILHNNIIYGFATGIAHAASNGLALGNYNNFYNNDTDRSSVYSGKNDLSLNPSFTGVSQVTVTAATTSNSGNTLTKTGATFQTSGVVAGRDYVWITSTSGTAGIYGISSVDSETQLTLDLAPGNSTGDVSAQITVGRNWSVGTNMKAAALPSAFSGLSTTTSYNDLGAVQRQESAGGGGLAANPMRGFIAA